MPEQVTGGTTECAAAPGSHGGLEDGVLAAATDLVDAFGRHDTTAYFEAFDPRATFIFHNCPERLASRAAYEELWQRWVNDDGFTVLACESSNQSVQMLGSTGAVFSHDVSTTVRTHAGTETTQERETIVFELVGGAWLAVHEHLSPKAAD
jgi:hypothetical protein